MNRLPKSYGIYINQAGEKHPVILYLNKLLSNQGSKERLGGYGIFYYGVDVKGNIRASAFESNFATILTVKEFLDLTKETMTKQEIEDYRDFKKEDILYHKNYGYFKVIETLGDLVFKSFNFNSVETITNFVNPAILIKEQIYKQGYRLYAPEEKIEEEILELTLEDIASKYGKKVEEIKIKK